MTTLKPNTANIVPTENFLLFDLAEDRKTTVGTLLTGSIIPLQNMEYELIKTCSLVKARLEKQGKS